MSLFLICLHFLVCFLCETCLIIHSTCYTSIYYTLHVTCYMLHVTCYMLHVTCYMLHSNITCYMYFMLPYCYIVRHQKDGTLMKICDDFNFLWFQKYFLVKIFGVQCMKTKYDVRLIILWTFEYQCSSNMRRSYFKVLKTTDPPPTPQDQPN